MTGVLLFAFIINELKKRIRFNDNNHETMLNKISDILPKENNYHIYIGIGIISVIILFINQFINNLSQTGGKESDNNEQITCSPILQNHLTYSKGKITYPHFLEDHLTRTNVNKQYKGFLIEENETKYEGSSIEKNEKLIEEIKTYAESFITNYENIYMIYINIDCVNITFTKNKKIYVSKLTTFMDKFNDLIKNDIQLIISAN